MFIYIFNYFLIIFFYFISNVNQFKKFYIFFWSLLLFYLFLFVSLRFEVSPDWIGYQNIYNHNLEKNNLFFFDENQDLVFFLLIQISILTNTGLVGVNFFIALIFFVVFYFYTKDFSNKYFSLFISYPIIIIVLQMGYIRQGLAFSFFLLILYYCKKKKYFYALSFISLAFLSHKSSLIILPIFIFKFFNDKYSFKKNIHYSHSLFLFIIISLFLSALIILLFKHMFIHFFTHYVLKQETFSFGSLVRGFLILIISLFFIYFRKNIIINTNELMLYIFMAYLSCLLFLIIFIAPIAADRLLLYFQVLPLFLLGNLNFKKSNFNKLIGYSILFAYKFYFLIWLFYGVNSDGYIPYKSIFSLI